MASRYGHACSLDYQGRSRCPRIRPAAKLGRSHTAQGSLLPREPVGAHPTRSRHPRPRENNLASRDRSGSRHPSIRSLPLKTPRSEETLATYADGSAAIAMRRTADGVSLFVGPPGLTSELLRLTARASGVPLFTECDCNVYANGPYLVLHASQDGPLEVDTGVAGSIRDLLDDKVIGQGPRIIAPDQEGRDSDTCRGRQRVSGRMSSVARPTCWPCG